MPEKSISAEEAGAIDVDKVRRELSEIVNEMNIPTHRRNIENISNLVWLNHHIKHQTIQHPRSERARALIEQFVKAHVPNQLRASSRGLTSSEPRVRGGKVTFKESPSDN